MSTTQPAGYSIPQNIMGIDSSSTTAGSDTASQPKRSSISHLPPRPVTPAPTATPEPIVSQRRTEETGRRVASTTWLPNRLVDLVREEYTTRGIGAGDLFKAAIEFASDELARLVNETRPADDDGGLFAPDNKRRRAFDEPTQTVSFRMSKPDQRTLDALVRRWGATSRAHLIGCALDHYFTHRNDKE